MASRVIWGWQMNAASSTSKNREIALIARHHAFTRLMLVCSICVYLF